MAHKVRVSTVALLLLTCLHLQPGYAARPSPRFQRDKDLRTLVNLLDYIGKDYSNAVNNGTIINPAEYRELSEFSRQAADLFGRLEKEMDNPALTRLGRKVTELENAIRNKSSVRNVSRLAGEIRQQILGLNLIAVTPPGWPDLKNGAALFGTHCTSCHGTNGSGNGPLAPDLTPPPSDFHDSTLASQLSPLQAYHTIRLGIEGTGMRPFRELSEQEAWDLAFYLNTLRYRNSVSESTRETILEALKDTVSLRTLATLPNKEWISYLKDRGMETGKALNVLRTLEEPPDGTNSENLNRAITLLNRSYHAYANGSAGKAGTLALNAYLEGVEPVESQIKANNPSLVYRIEKQMLDVRSAIKEHVADEVLQEKIGAAVRSVREAQGILEQEHDSFWFSYIMAGSILLREGLEAFLIILVILGVLKSAGASKSANYVHGGWLLALLTGIASWFFTEHLMHMSSVQRELMEGFGTLLAVGLLVYVGFWLHDKTHVSHWKEFVEERIKRLADRNNRWGLALLSFIVVFREAFESVIFLSSISIQSEAAARSGILLGSGSAILAVIVLGVFLVQFSAKIPIRTLFRYSSGALAVLAVILVGKSIHEFQEAGYLGISSLPPLLNLPTIGLYPTLQTFGAQFLTVGIIAGLWTFSTYRTALAKGS